MSTQDTKPTWFDRLTQLLTALGGGAGLVALLVYFLGAEPFKSNPGPDSEVIIERNSNATTSTVKTNTPEPEDFDRTQRTETGNSSETGNSTESSRVGSWTGTWTGPDGLSCNFFQGQGNQYSFNCTRITVQGVVTSEGQGEIVGNQAEFQFWTSLGTTGTGEMTIADNGREARGYSLESNGVRLALYLVKQN